MRLEKTGRNLGINEDKVGGHMAVRQVKINRTDYCTFASRAKLFSNKQSVGECKMAQVIIKESRDDEKDAERMLTEE